LAKKEVWREEGKAGITAPGSTSVWIGEIEKGFEKKAVNSATPFAITLKKMGLVYVGGGDHDST